MRLFLLHPRSRALALLHHAAKSVFTTAHLADVNEFVGLRLAVAFGDVFMFAAWTVMTRNGAGFRLGPGLGCRRYDGHPTVLALRAGHNNCVARLNGFRVGNSFDGVELHQFGGTLLFRRPNRRQKDQGGDRQSGEAGGEVSGGLFDGFHIRSFLVVLFIFRAAIMTVSNPTYPAIHQSTQKGKEVFAGFPMRRGNLSQDVAIDWV